MPSTATSPAQFGLSDWRAVLTRTFSEAGRDNLGLIAAGVAFYGFLAIVPLLGALVMTYGLVATPATVIENVRALMQVMPAEAAGIIGDQLTAIVAASEGKKGLGLLLALGIALFGARNGAAAIVTALNIAYEEEERRGFVKLTLIALAMTAASVVAAIVATLAIGALAQLNTLLVGWPWPVLLAVKLASWVLLVLVGAGGAATLYRYAPCRAAARWAWLTPGSLFASLGWGVLTLGFAVYVANFGNYGATYGSLGAIVALLTWMWLTAYVLLIGAELNAELEHQTAADTTTGAPQPMGARRAEMADTVVA